MNRRLLIVIALALVAATLLVSCNGSSRTCYYGYFEDQAYAFVYKGKTNELYGIRLPLQQILLWGKASSLDSIPTAMRNFVGLKDQGFLIGTSSSLRTLWDLLDALGSESDDSTSNAKRLGTMVAKADILSKKPLSDKIIQLCGSDSVAFLKLLSDAQPVCYSYDAQGFFQTDDLNFSQRYFAQWLEQVLGGQQ